MVNWNFVFAGGCYGFSIIIIFYSLVYVGSMKYHIHIGEYINKIVYNGAKYIVYWGFDNVAGKLFSKFM